MPPRKLFPLLAALLFLMVGADCGSNALVSPPVVRDLYMQLNNQSSDTVHFGFDPATMFSLSPVLPGRSLSRFQVQEMLPYGELETRTGYVGKRGAVVGSATKGKVIEGEAFQVVYIFTWDGQRLTAVR